MKSPPDPPSAYATLDGVLASCWTWMERGVHDRRCPTHHPTFVSIRVDGRPTCRTVILRECTSSQRLLGFHTDRRSRKWQEVQETPSAAIHVYLPQQQLQFRFTGIVERVVEGEANTERWLNMHPNSRRCYQTALAPATSIDSPWESPAQDDNPMTGVENFGWIRFRVEELEWLYLSSRGHQRALFSWNEKNERRATWMMP